jgi:hypothetical protein
MAGHADCFHMATMLRGCDMGQSRMAAELEGES